MEKMEDKSLTQSAPNLPDTSLFTSKTKQWLY